MFKQIIVFLLDEMDQQSKPKKLYMKKKRLWMLTSARQTEILLRMSISVMHFFINNFFNFL